MPLDLGNMRYAHCEGYTDVCYDNNGRFVNILKQNFT